MSKTRKIKKPDKRAREAGEELVRLSSWGMVSRIEAGAELQKLKYTFAWQRTLFLVLSWYLSLRSGFPIPLN
jgi:hypothetical protein